MFVRVVVIVIVIVIVCHSYPDPSYYHRRLSSLDHEDCMYPTVIVHHHRKCLNLSAYEEDDAGIRKW